MEIEKYSCSVLNVQYVQESMIEMFLKEISENCLLLFFLFCLYPEFPDHFTKNLGLFTKKAKYAFSL